MLTALAQKELHSCPFQGSGTQTPNKFPLALFHIILLLSASRSSPNVLAPRGPLSSMKDGFRLDKWLSIYHCGAPVATTDTPLSPSTSGQSDGCALALLPPLSQKGYQECWGLWEGESRLSHFHVPRKALLVCGDPTYVVFSPVANPCNTPSSTLQPQPFF